MPCFPGFSGASGVLRVLEFTSKLVELWGTWRARCVIEDVGKLFGYKRFGRRAARGVWGLLTRGGGARRTNAEARSTNPWVAWFFGPGHSGFLRALWIHHSDPPPGPPATRSVAAIGGVAKHWATDTCISDQVSKSDKKMRRNERGERACAHRQGRVTPPRTAGCLSTSECPRIAPTKWPDRSHQQRRLRCRLCHCSTRFDSHVARP